jgi:aminocarboxymuconate-semialdehyde decarboxylase
MGIDIQAVSIGPDQYFYWAEGELGPRLSRMQNDHLAEVVAAHPDRFVGLGTLPLQDPRAAVAEMERISRVHGFPGVSIGTSVAGRDFDLPEFQPLWEKAEELGILVVLHPYGFDAADRLGEYYLTNVVAMPLESTIAVSRMILGGVFERHPDLKLLIVHGGGYLPFYFARSDHAYRHRPELRANISRLPSEYLSMLYFDTCLHASHPVEHLVQHFGSDHVLLGTDYPYDMGVTDPLALLASADQLTDEDREKISGGNARGLLGLA